MRHPIRESIGVDVPITLEPGPHRKSPSKLLYLGPGFSYTSAGKRRVLEAILAALSRDRLACGLRGLSCASRGTRFSSVKDLLVGGRDRWTG